MFTHKNSHLRRLITRLYEVTVARIEFLRGAFHPVLPVKAPIPPTKLRFSHWGKNGDNDGRSVAESAVPLP